MTTTDTMLDSAGHELRAGVVHKSHQQPGRAPAHRADMMALAESVRCQLRARDAALDELRRELAALRDQMNMQRAMADLSARVEKLEAAPRSAGLRAV